MQQQQQQQQQLQQDQKQSKMRRTRRRRRRRRRRRTVANQMLVAVCRKSVARIKPSKRLPVFQPIPISSYTSARDHQLLGKKMLENTATSWIPIILEHAQRDDGEEASKAFQQMQQHGVSLNKNDFLNILKACTSAKTLGFGKRIHAHIVRVGMESNLIVGTALVSMYSRCGRPRDARSVFDKLSEPDIVAWTALIAGCAAAGPGDTTSSLACYFFLQMQKQGIKVDKVVLISMLSACSNAESMAIGKLVHAFSVDSGFKSDIFVGTALLSMYVKCGFIQEARRVFDNMPTRNAASWNAMIAGYARYGYCEKAFQLFQQMGHAGAQPNKTTFVSILNACSLPEALGLGKLLHAHIVYRGMESDVIVGTAIVSMYGRCRSMEDAWKTFCKMPGRNIVSWNAVIAGCALHGYDKEAFQLFLEMEREGVKSNTVTCLNSLNACVSSQSLALGRLVHAYILDSKMVLDVVLGTALVSMYGRCGKIEDARRIFDTMPERNVVSRMAMITAYAQLGRSKEILQVFQQMQEEGVKPNNVTCISLLDACANLEALEQGRVVHAYIIDSGMESDIIMGTALVSMYSRCGSIESARKVFNKMLARNVVSWNSIFAGYAQHGQGKEVLELFQQMQSEGINPNEVTMISVLSACSHSGLVDDGWYLFNAMSQNLGLTPTLDHYNCIVDLLGRAGQLDEAENFISKMPFQPNASTWITFLGSCRAHGCIHPGKWVAECVFQLDPSLPSGYVTLSNIYAAAGRWEDGLRMRKVM